MEQHPAYEQGEEIWEVMEQYDLNPTVLQYTGGVWRVVTDEGVFALKKSPSSKEKLLLLNEMLTSAQKEGFPHLITWKLTKQGEPIAEIREEIWYASPWKEPVGIGEPETKPSAKELVQSIAQFHRVCEKLVKEYPELTPTFNKDLVDDWKESRDHFIDLTRFQEEREFRSPFDQVVYTNQDHVERMFNFAIKGMERLIETEQGKYPRTTLCHRRVHPSNVVYDDQDYYFIDFDHAEVDTPIRDLALVLRRYTKEKGYSETPDELIQCYHEVNPLQPIEKKLLALYLLYPERLLKALRHYYESPQIAQQESQCVKHLEAEFRHYDGLQDVARNLWSTKITKQEEKKKPTAVRPVTRDRRKGKRKT
ncbi:phosphotransferase [Hazenella coriacea]|uniref:Spore coat protein YsxE n=1 Tax=Hazenella coriacea TaxID=1179467 RepID=A0A4R3LBD4_9BACL|nr:phosphotransferase [Hazenella coriacea]TCS96520.1 spore coat protein YsxE [Hazenella coriacea]